jgi:hypothetical protein
MAIDKTIKITADTGDAQKKVDELKTGVEGIDAGAAASKKGFSIMRRGVQAVGLSLKAMGIGLVIAAFVQLKEMFMSNQAIMDSVSAGAETMKAVFQELIDIALPLGEALTSAFTDPKDAINDLWEALKDNLVNRINGLIDQFKGLGKIIKGVFKMDWEMITEGANDAASATVQLYTGLDDIQRANISNTFKKTTKQLKKVTKEANAYAKVLVRMRNEVKLAEADQRQLQLLYQRDAELQRQVRDDISLTFEERIAANEELGRILDEQFKEEQALAQKKIDLAQMELDQNSTNIDLQVALKNAKTEMMDLDERITGQRSEQLTNLNALEKERADAQSTRNELTKRALELGLEFQKTTANEEIKLLIETEEEKLAIRKKSVEDAKKLQDAEIASRKAATTKAYSSILGSMSQLAGEGTKTGKAFALSQILIDTAMGISGSISNAVASAKLAGPGAAVVTPLLIAQLLAQVMAGIGSAKSILAKVPGPGGEGPMPSVAAGGGGDIGGIGGMIPNLEAISPEVNGIQPVQAFVVENDISNAQALQEELDIQATL